MISVVDLKKYFPVVSGIRSLFSRSRGKVVKAVDSVSFEIPSGSVLGLVGESGCGKTTTGRILVRLDQATSGEVLINGENGQELRKKDLKGFYRKAQMIFQDPYGSIKPQHNVTRILSKPLWYQGVRDRAHRRRRGPLRGPSTSRATIPTSRPYRFRSRVKRSSHPSSPSIRTASRRSCRPRR